jgi:hypothetical protein
LGWWDMRRGKKNAKKKNLNVLLKEMEKLSEEPNDREICKKFKLLIESNVELDIPRQTMNEIIEDPEGIDDKDIPESIMPFIRHYIFMRKRAQKKAERR